MAIEKISISPGNSKMGDVPSISLPPVKTCPPHSPCVPHCYALRMACRRKNIKQAWERNYRVLQGGIDVYFNQLHSWLYDHNPPYFRFHVGGDIPTIEYLEYMEYLASDFPATHFLAYSRQPFVYPPNVSNLNILKSVWLDEKSETSPYFPNYYVYCGLPFSRKVAKDCPGKCGPCGYACWYLKRGMIIQAPPPLKNKGGSLASSTTKQGDLHVT